MTMRSSFEGESDAVSDGSDADARTLLLVGGGVETVAGIARLKALGLQIAVSDGDRNAPAFEHADFSLLSSTYDVEGTVRAAQELHRVNPIHGVMSIATDVPLTVASVAEALGLPGIPVRSARIAANKLAMMVRLRRHGVSVPPFWSVGSAAELESIAVRRGTTMIVKPVDSRGARGVIRLTPDVEPGWAFETARAESPTGGVLLEDYIEGPQISSESLIIEGRAVTVGFADRNYEHLQRYAPYMIENGGDQPSVHREVWLERVNQLIETTARALEIRNGVIKGDIVLSPSGGPMLIEVAPRLSGGYFCTDQIPLSTGVDLVTAAARLALGERLNPRAFAPREWRSVAIRYFSPPEGRLREVAGLREVKSQPWVHRAELFVGPGQRIHSPSNHTERVGFVIASGEDRDQARQRAEAATRAVHFQLD